MELTTDDVDALDEARQTVQKVQAYAEDRNTPMLDEDALHGTDEALRVLHSVLSVAIAQSDDGTVNLE